MSDDRPRLILTDETTVLFGPGLIITQLASLDEYDDLGIGQGVVVAQGVDEFPGTVSDITYETHKPFRTFIHIKTVNPLKDAIT